MTETETHNHEEEDVHATDERKNGQDVEEEHLPEWNKVFRKLKEEAEELYPDGRVRIVVPRKKRRSKST